MSIKKAIVTGGTGFIGSHIVDRLIDMGCDVVIIDRTDNPKNFNSKAKLFKGDITKLDPSAEIPVEFDGKQVTNENFILLTNLSEILQDSGELGEMELDIFKITISSLETYEKELIKCDV